MIITVSFRKILPAAALLCAAAILGSCLFLTRASPTSNEAPAEEDTGQAKEFIKWVDFNVSYEALCDTMEIDVDTYGTEQHYSWIDLLAYLAAKNGNNFSSYKKKDLNALMDKLNSGTTLETLTKEMKYFPYYQETIGAVLSEFIGEYSIQTKAEDGGEPVWEQKYGLKAFSPIAKNFGFEHYDDFANARSYGYQRKHTGHDLFGSIGTPVVAVESGTVECVGWNQYGGWRIGIRSFDQKRYYYYAHLRKDHPYSPLIEEGACVKAGDVIGYLGMTGYSAKENVNNINVPHLHMGIQLIFDESQKDGPTEIWIDDYNLVKFLQKNKSEVYKDEEKKEYYRKYDFNESAIGGN